MEDSTKENRHLFRIAGHLVELCAAAGIQVNQCLPSFKDFVETDEREGEDRVRVEVRLDPASPEKGETELLSDRHVSWQNQFRFEESAAHYITSIETEGSGNRWEMHSTKEFDHSVVYACKEEIYSTQTLAWLLMVAFAQAALAQGIVLIHSSVIEKGGKGYAFLGKSGTGKSTHSRMWLSRYPEAALLNDDNPALRIYPDGRIRIYGTPWSGKTLCYRNKGVELRAVVRLEQASKNRFWHQKGVHAFTAVLPSCSAIRWNKSLFDRMVDLVEKMVERITVGKMECLPNTEAAEICFEGINNK